MGVRTGLGMAAARAAPPPRDPTLELIHKIKAEHAASQGVVVSESEALRGEKRLREKGERAAAYAARRGEKPSFGCGNPNHNGGGGGGGGQGAPGMTGAVDDAVGIAIPPPKMSITGGAGAAGAPAVVVGKLVRKKAKTTTKKPATATGAALKEKKGESPVEEGGGHTEEQKVGGGGVNSSEGERASSESQAGGCCSGGLMGLVGYGSSDEE